MTRTSWHVRERSIDLGARTCVMAVLNVTPDSFSDGGRYIDPEAAIARARVMLEEGADIIDIGGESSRPGAEPVSPHEELRRVLPVVRALAGIPEITLSIDTTKAEVADAALAAGAHIVNDISGLAGDPGMLEVIRRHRAGAVIMHMQGSPGTMQHDPRYVDVVAEVSEFLHDRVAAATARGIDASSLVIDPGIGFGKTLEHNIALLKGIRVLRESAGRPVLIGVSRKRFLGAITGRDVGDRLAAGLGAAAFAIMQGASVMRVHDVKESCDLARMIDRLNRQQVFA